MLALLHGFFIAVTAFIDRRIGAAAVLQFFHGFLITITVFVDRRVVLAFFLQFHPFLTLFAVWIVFQSFAAAFLCIVVLGEDQSAVPAGFADDAAWLYQIGRCAIGTDEVQHGICCL